MNLIKLSHMSQAFQFCAQAIFKIVFFKNPPALENLLLKIILVVKILADPKLTHACILS